MDQSKRDLDFYCGYAKPLIPVLPEVSDRVKASAWLTRLRKETTNIPERDKYLKLLVVLLHRQTLQGPFQTLPQQNAPLEPLPANIDVQDLANMFAEVTGAQGTSESGERPPVSIAMTSDMKEYAAAQRIPNFGIHCFYAVSNEPMTQWNISGGALQQQAGAGAPCVCEEGPQQRSGTVK